MWKEKWYTLEKLAKRIGITTGYLCHLELGTRKNPSKDLMWKIAKELNKTVEETFYTDT